MKLSLVIPAHNEERYIGLCLDSIQEFALHRCHEIIVIDNASTDRTAEVARSRPWVRVVHEEHKGLTHARHRGLQEATGDLIAYIDADTRLSGKWLNIVDLVFKSLPNVVCLSGCYRYYDGSQVQRALLNAIWWISAPLAYRFVRYMVLGGNFVARTSALRAIGGFDRSIHFYGEDTDIARRLHGCGMVLFRMDFYVHTSMRRFLAEGFTPTLARYALNFLWPALVHRPFSSTYRDIR